MTEASTGLFTIGVFQDVAWADKGIQALKSQRFPTDAMSFIAKETPEVAALAERTFAGVVPTLDVKGLGTVRARGPLVAALQGSDADLTRFGIAATARRVGFQPHDGRIFETLTDRGGVLIAIASDARAADALAILHSYGGGNAAIGAWAGRL
jgi:hypothetical protein